MRNHHRIRAWDKQNSHYWYFNFMAGHWESEPVLGEVHICGQVKTYWEIELCSGISDKNGKLIYENDRAKYGNEIIGTVRYSFRRAGYRIFTEPAKLQTAKTYSVADCGSLVNTHIEIIGTSHEAE